MTRLCECGHAEHEHRDYMDDCSECGCEMFILDDGDEPDISDAVLACPDCDRPNQFGQVCDSCERDRQDAYEAAAHGA